MTVPEHHYRPLIEAACKRAPPLEPNVLEAVVWTESNFDRMAKSASNALGLTQIIYAHHTRMVDEVATRLGYQSHENTLYVPEVSLQAGARHLAWLYTSDGAQSWERAVRAFHSGSPDPPSGFVDGQGTSSDQHIAKFRANLEIVRADIARVDPSPQPPPAPISPPGGSTVAITFGKVPHPEYVPMLWISTNKVEGMGWDNLGQRKPKFIALHRMWGTLAGTDSYFAPATSPHLTDYAIGVEAIDGRAKAGEIHQYNDPRGYRSGWASGRVSAPYGDGKAIVDKYGVIAVNRDGVSIELSGYDETVVDEFSWREYVQLCAYWCDQMRIPWDKLPINPATGISAFVWHQEFTIGTGKKCPFAWLLRHTTRLITDVKTLLKQYQEGSLVGPVIEPATPAPAPAPQFPDASPIAALIPFKDGDPDAIPAVVKDTNNEALEFEWIGDTYELTVKTPQYRYANRSGSVLGSDRPIGFQFYVPFLVDVKAKDGTVETWLVDENWRRTPRKNAKRVKDTK